MINLQEMILRGRFIMAEAPERLKVFERVNSKRTAEDIAKLTKRHVNSVRRDLTKLADVGLIQPCIKDGAPVKQNGFLVYEKVQLARAVPLHYFNSPARLPRAPKGLVESVAESSPRKQHKPKPLAVPTQQEILDIARNGESQIHEFKGQGTEARKITKEIAAMLHTRQGGIIFYGIDDDGNIEGSDIPVQKLDQPLQNSIKNSISPAATVRLNTVSVLGNSIIVIIVPPWNKTDVYQFDEKILIRKGTNVFAAKPEEVKKLHSRQYVV